MAYAYSGILLSTTKVTTSEIPNDTDETQNIMLRDRRGAQKSTWSTVIWKGKKGNVVAFGRYRGGFTGKRNEETLRDDGYVLYLIRVLMYRYMHLLDLVKWYTSDLCISLYVILYQKITMNELVNDVHDDVFGKKCTEVYNFEMHKKRGIYG